MLPEEAPPPGLAEMFGPPDSIQVTPPEDEEFEDEEMSDEELISDAIDALQQAMQNTADDADSQKLAKVVQELYALKAGNQDAAMSAMGGNPKQMRAMQRANG